MKKEYLIALMILVPLIGFWFNIYALFLVLPLGLYFNNKNAKK